MKVTSLMNYHTFPDVDTVRPDIVTAVKDTALVR